MKKTLLITGVSSGIGLGMAKRFLASDYRVIGSVRSREHGEGLEKTLGPNFHSLVFDLENAVEIERAKWEVEEILAGQPLTALVNNAGSAELAPLLYVPLDDFRQQLEVLVVGQLAVIQQFHGFLLPQRGAGVPGRIINISSVSGVHANPFFGGYAAGKHALEGLSKTLREELRGLGIPVVVVAPSNIGTSIWAKQTKELADRFEGTPYYSALLALVDHIRTSIAPNAMTVEEFADAFVEIIVTPSPAERYTVVKSKSRRNPFTQAKIRLIEG